jgi:hypothetical protein
MITNILAELGALLTDYGITPSAASAVQLKTLFNRFFASGSSNSILTSGEIISTNVTNVTVDWDDELVSDGSGIFAGGLGVTKNLAVTATITAKGGIESKEGTIIATQGNVEAGEDVLASQDVTAGVAIVAGTTITAGSGYVYPYKPAGTITTAVRQTKYIEIGTWNMYTAQTKAVAHGLTGTQARTIVIRGVTIYRDDSTVDYRPLVLDANTVWDATNITLYRAADSAFADNNWDDTSGSYNRGLIEIDYTP